jgi:molybdate transport system regulatory protein
MAILESVEKFGSIAAAAESVGWTYRKTWSIVHRMNLSLGEVVITNRGRQGGAHLSLRGKKILKRYRELERKVYEVFADDLQFLAECVGDDPKAAPYIPRWARVEEPKGASAISSCSKRINSPKMRDK